LRRKEIIGPHPAGFVLIFGLSDIAGIVALATDGKYIYAAGWAVVLTAITLMFIVETIKLQRDFERRQQCTEL
jgi:hypothetical protein